MDDLISRAALLDEFHSLCGPQTCDGWDNMGVRNLIMRQKAVDAVPVVHAHWKAYSVPHWTKRYDDNGDPEYKYHNEYTCSICRRRTIIKENFCPSCGADMRGESQ